MPALSNREPFSIRRLGTWIRQIIAISATAAIGWLLGRGVLSYVDAMAVFELRRIEVRGNNILTRSEVVDAMAPPLTGSVFEVNLLALQERVEALNYVYGVRLGRKFPHTLFVDIVENQPLAYVAAPEYYILTSEQEALPLPRGRFELELPTVSGADSALDALTLGTISGHEQLKQAWEILHYIHSSFPALYRELSELVFAANGEITLYMAETSTAVHLGNKDLERRIAMLDAFLITLSGKRSLADYSYIDLRYERQVVVRERA